MIYHVSFVFTKIVIDKKHKQILFEIKYWVDKIKKLYLVQLRVWIIFF